MSIRRFIALSGADLSNRAHTCVVFGGWGAQDAGKEFVPYNKSGAATFAEKVRALGLSVKDWQGQLKNDGLLESAITFIRESFNPKGKLIVYGYSAGGMNAIDLTKELYSRLHYFRDGKFSGSDKLMTMHKATNSNESNGDDVVVDLLITVDAYRPGASSSDRQIRSNVRQFINIYQTFPQAITGSHGAPLTRARKADSTDCNQDRSSRFEYYMRGAFAIPNFDAHAYIDEDTEQVAYEKVEALITNGPKAVNCTLG